VPADRRSAVQDLPPIPVIEQELGRRSLRNFCKLAWPLVEPGRSLVWGYHLDVVCDHLEAVWPHQHIRNLIITVPPRHSKSTVGSVLWPAWVWTDTPETRFLTGSYAEDLAIRDAVRSRRVIASPWYQQRWGEGWELTGDQNTKSRYENTRLGYRLAIGVGGGTGEGGDVLLVDDPHHLDDAFRATAREAVKTWWDSTFSGRVNDPRKSARVIIMQRVHEDDLVKHILDKDPENWTHLSMPSVAEPRSMRPPPTQHLAWTDPREEGDLLWPERFGPEEVAQRKLDLGPALWAAQDQQRPAPLTGVIYAPDAWQFYDQAPDPETWDDQLQSWDLAFEADDTSSYVVGQAWCRVGADRYLLGQFRERVDFTHTIDAVAAMMATWPDCRPVVIENKANGPALLSVLTQGVPELAQELEAYSPKGSKEQRAWAQQPLQHAGRLWLPRAASWVPGFIEEHRRFPRADADDQVDAQSQANAKLTERMTRKRSAAQMVAAVRSRVQGPQTPIDRLRRHGLR